VKAGSVESGGSTPPDLIDVLTRPVIPRDGGSPAESAFRSPPVRSNLAPSLSPKGRPHLTRGFGAHLFELWMLTYRGIT
jgi:hypothetical protein